MKKQIFSKVLSATLLIAFMMMFSTVTAQRRRTDEPREPRAVEELQQRPLRENGFCRNLPGITQEQTDQIDKLRQQNMKNTQQLRNTVFEKRAHLRTLSATDNPDTDAINKTIDDISGIRAEIEKGRMATHQKIRNILTEEQRVIFDNAGAPGRKRPDSPPDRVPERRGPGFRENCPYRK